jgi:hypothetical protein
MVARRNATKITTWCTNKRSEKHDYGARRKAKKSTIWCTKKSKKYTKHVSGAAWGNAKKKSGAKHTVVLLIVVFPSKIATPRKKKRFEAPFGARWIYSFSLLQSRGWRKQAKKIRTEPRKAHILNLWCVMCDTQKLLQLSWIDRLCNPKLPTCLQTAVILLWKNREFMVRHLGVFFSKTPCYSSREIHNTKLSKQRIVFSMNQRP